MTRCSHPNIGKLSLVDSYSAGVDYLFSLEEFLCGGTLTSKLSGGALNRDRVLGLGELLIDAVSHIASQGLVHRDLKPDNVLFRSDGVTPVIVDFGIVRDLTLSSLTESWLSRGPGTPLFAPPEQLNNEKALINWRADQFSLGILLSISAFCFHPFEENGYSPAQIVQHVAARRQSTSRFKTAAQACRLPVLIKMTDTWPISRFRRPDELGDAWRRQS
jgi:serine/threonine protein kinase